MGKQLRLSRLRDWDRGEALLCHLVWREMLTLSPPWVDPAQQPGRVTPLTTHHTTVSTRCDLPSSTDVFPRRTYSPWPLVSTTPKLERRQGGCVHSCCIRSRYLFKEPLDTGQWPTFLALPFSLVSQVVSLGTRKGLVVYQSFFPGKALDMTQTMVSGAPWILKE